MRSILFISLSSLLILAYPTSATAKDAITAKNGMVVCVSPSATDVGVEILKKGGNAVDATVAVAFAMAVTYPPAGNIGGGGFMMVYPGADKPVTCIEYRETAPAATNKDTFIKQTDWYNHKAAGVPGTVRGMELAHKKFGKLSWKEVVWPAVLLAENGFLLDEAMVKSLNRELKSAKANEEFQRVLGKNNGKDPWKVGDRWIQKDLAKTLKQIAEQGADAFYTGELAELLEAEMKQGDGFITKADLSKYQAKQRQPIHGTYRGYDIYGPPPPSSGGICIVQMLNMLEGYDLRKMGRWSVSTNHLLVEVMRRSFCDRAKYLGDPDFTKIPVHLTSKEHAKYLIKGLDLHKATTSRSLASYIPIQSEGESTTHFSVIDVNGMAVSNTYTLENSYGSRVVVRGAGYLLNNEMGDFNSQPGVTNTKGRIGTEPNLVAPGKRMLSSQTPILVLKDGRPYLITGSPGGRTIINTTLCIVVNVLDFEMSIQEAVDAPRLHHQWLPDVIQFEKRLNNPDLLKELEKLGHKIDPKAGTQGDAHSIWIDPKTKLYHGAKDSRINGKAAGY